MRPFIYCIVIGLLVACSGEKTPPPLETPLASMPTDSVTDSETDDFFDEEYSDMATYYVVIADTGLNYNFLFEKLGALSKNTTISIDLMGRNYDKKKNLIALPEDDEDEIYAGDYFPRRFPSEFLSLEYLDFYQDNAGEKTIALVAGIFEEEKDAKNLLSRLKKFESKAFQLKSEMYIGCMH